MSRTLIETHVARTTRNLLAVNGVLFALLLLLFAVFVGMNIALSQKMEESRARLDVLNGRDVLGASAAADLRHPVALNGADVDEARLSALMGKAVALRAPQAVSTMIPVEHWIERATGKRQPKAPPGYVVLQTRGSGGPGGPPPGFATPGMINPMGGPALVILPADFVAPSGPKPTFVGVVRPLQETDRRAVDVVLKSHGFQAPPLPLALDCLNVGAKGASRVPAAPPVGSLFRFPPSILLLFAGLIGLCAWNVWKGLARRRNPRLHPVYARLARFGPPADMERHIEADRVRGVQRLGPVEFTPAWLLAPSFFGLDPVPLDGIVWIYRPRKVRLRRGMLLHYFIASMTLIFLDRTGKTHVVRGADGLLNEVMAAVRRGRPWMEAGEPNDLRRQYGDDKAGFIAAVEARRRQMGGPATPPIP